MHLSRNSDSFSSLPFRCRVAAVLLVLTVTACGSDQGSSPPLVALAPLASIPAPLSTSTEITLVDEDTACVINSYESRIHCVGRAGLVVGAFGGEGEGPGESNA